MLKMTFNRKVMFSSMSGDWQTPDELYNELHNEFGFDFDPCPPKEVRPPEMDGLNMGWGLVNFCNPPYGTHIKKWIEKGFGEWKKGRTVVFLIPSRTDTKWWHDYIMKADEIRFIKGRLKFKGAKNSAPFPSAIVVFYGDIKSNLKNAKIETRA